MGFSAMDTPAEFFGAGYALASNAISLNTATKGSDIVLAQLTDTDANATTGKTQQVCLALCEAIYAKWLAVATADRAANMSVTRQSGVDDTTSTRTVSYVLTFKADASVLTTVRPEA
jgi:hypothetical protein